LTRAELLKIKRARLKDAHILYENRQYDGAVYICGYAVEIALKARICKTLKWIDGYPDTKGEFEHYTSFKTHDLDTLLRMSGIEEKIKSAHFSEWSAVAKWNPEARYKQIGNINKVEAANIILAATILAWHNMNEKAEKVISLEHGLDEFVKKFVSIEREISEEKGDFNLFALFLREDTQDKWDIIVSAPWAKKNEQDALKYLSDKIVPRLSSAELLLLSRIIILETNNQAVKALNKGISQTHGISEIKNSNFLGLQIKHAYIVTSHA
jgi:hypothetical protein